MSGTDNIKIAVGSKVRHKKFSHCGTGVVTGLTDALLFNGWRLTNVLCDVQWDNEEYGISEQVPIRHLEAVK